MPSTSEQSALEPERQRWLDSGGHIIMCEATQGFPDFGAVDDDEIWTKPDAEGKNVIRRRYLWFHGQLVLQQLFNSRAELHCPTAPALIAPQVDHEEWWLNGEQLADERLHAHKEELNSTPHEWVQAWYDTD